MTLCNHCGAEVPESRYGRTSTLCHECELDAVDEAYRANQPTDDLDEPQASDRWTPAHEARTELRAQISAHQAEHQGKRPDQIIFSAAVVLICLALGVLIGAAVAFFWSVKP